MEFNESQCCTILIVACSATVDLDHMEWRLNGNRFRMGDPNEVRITLTITEPAAEHGGHYSCVAFVTGREPQEVSAGFLIIYSESEVEGN